MSIKLNENGSVDTSNVSSKVLPEQETRRKILNRCKEIGCYQQMVQIFEKYDRLLRNCSNEKEREDISKIGIMEAYQLLDRGGKLYINNGLVYVDKDCASNKE